MRAELDIGPYPLEWSVIDKAIVRRSAGIILLGEMAQNGRSFVPHRVKLATFDLKRELFGLVEEAEFEWFRCAYAPTELAARRISAHWRDALTHESHASSGAQRKSMRAIAR
jgi:hypothetical protein